MSIDYSTNYWFGEFYDFFYHESLGSKIWIYRMIKRQTLLGSAEDGAVGSEAIYPLYSTARLLSGDGRQMDWTTNRFLPVSNISSGAFLSVCTVGSHFSVQRDNESAA